jgi:putative flippase GtrA
MMPDLLRVDSRGYEFELDMLMMAKHHGWPVLEQTIRTIYEPGNKSSHFNPLLDSLRTYAVLLRFSTVSIVTALLDNLVFFLTYSQGHNIVVSQIAARSLAILFQYTAARRVVFLSHGRPRVQFPKFLLLALAHGLVSYTMIRGLVDSGWLGVPLAKPLTEGLLFFASFVLQREFVFSRPSEADSAEDAQTGGRAAGAASFRPVSLRFRAAAWVVFFAATLSAVWGMYSCNLLTQDMWLPTGLRRMELLAAWYVAWAAAFVFFAPAWFAPVTLLVSLAAFGAAFGPMTVLTVLLFLFSCAVTGALLLRREEAPDAVSRLLELLLGVAVWMAVVWVAVHFRVNYAGTYLAAFCVPLAIRPRLTRSRLADCARLFRPVVLPGRAAYAALALAVFPLLCHFLVMAKPDNGSDAGGVHLVLPLWVAFQHYCAFDFHSYTWTMMPLGADWCFTAVVVPGGEWAAHLLNFGFVAVLTGLIYVVSRRYLPPVWALLLAGLFASSPLAQLVTGSLFSENAWAAILFGAVLAVERFHTTGAPRWLYVAAALFGAALATKLGTTAFLLPAAGFAAWELLSRRRTVPNVARVAAIAIFLVLLFGAPPYVFSWVKTGNPLFPFANDVFKSPWFESRLPFVDARWTAHLNAYTFFDLFFHSHWFLECRDGATGFHYLLLVPLGLLALGRKRPYLAWLFFGVVLIAFILTLHALPYLRYLYPAFALVAAAGAITLGQLRTGDRTLFRAVIAVLLVASAFNIYFLPSSGFSHGDFFLNPFNRREWENNLKNVVPVQKLIAYLNQAHSEQPVAVFGTATIAGLRATAYEPGWRSWPYSHQLASLPSPEAYGRLAESLHIQHFVVPNKTSGLQVSPGVVARFMERYTELEYSCGGFDVRRLKAPATRGPVAQN